MTADQVWLRAFHEGLSHRVIVGKSKACVYFTLPAKEEMIGKTFGLLREMIFVAALWHPYRFDEKIE
jgi:hypothetical protein